MLGAAIALGFAFTPVGQGDRYLAEAATRKAADEEGAEPPRPATASHT